MRSWPRSRALGEGEGAGVGGGARGQLEQALVDRAQLLGLHVAPVDPVSGWPSGRSQARRMAASRRRLVMREAAAAGLAAREQAAQRRQAELRLAARERLEGRLQPLEGIGVLVPGGAAHAALAQAGDAIALGIDAARGRGGGRRMQQVAILGGEQEDQAVDQAEQLLEIGAGRGRRGQRLAERQVGRVLDEALAELLERRLDAQAQLLACGGALGPAALAPALERAVGERGLGGAPKRLWWIRSKAQ